MTGESNDFPLDFDNHNAYLSRYRFSPPSLTSVPTKALSIVIVIPCFNEPKLIESLASLWNCDRPIGDVEIITVINCGEHHSPEIKEHNLLTLEKAESWAKDKNTSRFRFEFILNNNLPKKHAGVGLARKIGMDEAVRRFEFLHKTGIISCYDADTLCASNYLIELENHFNKHKKTPACSIRYEHPLKGDLTPINYQGIIRYELHLRYFVNMLKWAGCTHAHQTIGSSMAVTSSAYQKQGGMPKKKAGEDFYFLHKIIPLGNFTNLNSTYTIPSPRTSSRVPFGTGKAINDYSEQDNLHFLTYSPQSFEDLKEWLDQVPSYYNSSIENIITQTSTLPNSIKAFLASQNFNTHIAEIKKQSTSEKIFENRFFRWFNGFLAMKYAHFSRDNYYPNTNIKDACSNLFMKLHLDHCDNEKAQLISLRLFDQLHT